MPHFQLLKRLRRTEEATSSSDEDSGSPLRFRTLLGARFPKSAVRSSAVLLWRRWRRGVLLLCCRRWRRRWKLRSWALLRMRKTTIHEYNI
ncbi:hypothetical protein L596_008637 [Steinernema carpocapsae]|uniref:Uncharacterized protein n=1 Tax=Steinernema carpocapsae TaxID=34508 RepID=A0A4U5PDL2_STECR|nr:hypothetical protein L596_008637 [Steinernema carpocapsae]